MRLQPLAGTRPVQTRFRYGSGCHPLNLATHSNSPAHSTKGTPSTCVIAEALTPRPLTVCRSTVSGSISLPSRGTFHLSLTVLFTIGHQACLALRCGQRGFTLDFACPGLLGMTLRRPVDFRLQGYYLLWLGFPTDSASRRFCNSSLARQSQHERSHNPASATAAALARTRFRLLPVRSPLLGECLFLRVLRCFSSPGALYPAYVFSRECLGISPGRFPHSDIPGSSLASSFPRHFAGSHVLLRRLVPRHPPWTLTSLSAYVHSSTAEDGSRSRIQTLPFGKFGKNYLAF
jgi:hypothetical protein